MAEIYEALELLEGDEPTGRFHYTRRSDEIGGPARAVGFCAQGCPGHSTPEEAKRHFDEYQVENNLRLGLNDPSTQKRCEVCGDWTQDRAQVGGPWRREFWLCAAHMTKAVVLERMCGGQPKDG